MKEVFTNIVPGDIDGFFGLMIDNLVQMLVIISLCGVVAGIPLEFIISVILPGAAVSLIIGNLFYSWQANKLMKKTGRKDVCALPYGINTISLFAFLFFIMLPVYQKTNDYRSAWIAGMVAAFGSGIIEILGAFVAEFIRKMTPRPALLAALGGVSLTFISMDFLFRTFERPLIAFLPLMIIFLQYFGRYSFPGRIPGGLFAVLVGTILAWIAPFWGEQVVSLENLNGSLSQFGFYPPIFSGSELFSEIIAMNWTVFFAVIFPMGLFNVISSLQNIESAEVAGDSYNTRNSLLVNGIGTIAGSLFGSPFPTTIYIGHPGWKELGARAGYSMLNGTVITLIALFGGMGFLAALIPIEAGMAIVLWIGVIIVSQAFGASEKSAFPAVVIGLLPAMASWAVMIIQNTLFYAEKQYNFLGKSFIENVDLYSREFPYGLAGVLNLSQGSLISSMLWASIAYFIIIKELPKATITCFIGAILSLLGIIHHYDLVENGIANFYQIPYLNQFFGAYLLTGCGIFLMHLFYKKSMK